LFTKQQYGRLNGELRQRKDNKVSEEAGLLQCINYGYAWLYSDLKVFRLLL